MAIEIAEGCMATQPSRFVKYDLSLPLVVGSLNGWLVTVVQFFGCIGVVVCRQRRLSRFHAFLWSSGKNPLEKAAGANDNGDTGVYRDRYCGDGGQFIENRVLFLVYIFSFTF